MNSDHTQDKSWETPDQVKMWNRSRLDREQLLGTATKLLLREAGIEEGMKVLDVAAGTGDQTFMAARMVGSSGKIVATDISSNMLQVLAQIAKHEGFSNVTTHAMDAQKVDLPPNSFDAAISRHGLMFVPKLEQALAGILNTLKVGSKFGALVWSSPEKNPALSLPMSIIYRYAGIPLTEINKKPGVFSLGDPETLELVFKTAGFKDISVQAVTDVHRYPSVIEFIRAREDVSAGPLGEILKHLSETDRKQMHIDVIKELRNFEGPKGFEGPAESLLVVGTKV